MRPVYITLRRNLGVIQDDDIPTGILICITDIGSL